jgi:N-acetylglucosaminyl-diphospho-decaprenol L-rhamnosyltransferase
MITINDNRSPCIYVVLPVFNRKSLTERFLRCMREQSFRQFQTVVVDDGSTDGTAELVAEQFPEVQLLRGDGNLWWTGAINVGIRHALARATSGDAILVINNDLEVGPDYLENLRAQWILMPHALIGSVAVDIDNPDLIVDGGTLVNWWTAKERKLNRGMLVSRLARSYCVEASWLTGRGTLIPVEVFRRIGLYNERHYQQSGDPELPVRAKAAGYRLIVSYACVVKTHKDATDKMNVSERFTLREFKRYFFDIKSNMRLKGRFFFAVDTAVNPLALVTFLSCDLVRIIGHFLTRVRLHN